MTADHPGVDQLKDDYVRAAQAHGYALGIGDAITANEAYDRLAAIYRQLRDAGLESQRTLLTLLNHENTSVRCWAASHALEFSPEQAERALAAVAESAEGPTAFNARMTLRQWRRGHLRFP